MLSEPTIDEARELWNVLDDAEGPDLKRRSLGAEPSDRPTFRKNG